MDDKNCRPLVFQKFCGKIHLAKRSLRKNFKQIFPARPKSLFLDIVRWVVLAFVVYTLLGALFVELPDGENRSAWHRIFAIWVVPVGGKPLDIVKIVITLVGGIGAIAYLVIRFRERTDQEAELEIKAAERNEVEKAGIEARFNKAIEQLGSTSPQVRIAGVYALTDVADTYLGIFQQRTVDILCGYLRTDRLESDGQSNDAAVESTILKVLREHLFDGGAARFESQQYLLRPEQLWVHCSLDLHGAVLTEDFVFDSCTFNSLNLMNAALLGKVSLENSHFKNAANFERISVGERGDSSLGKIGQLEYGFPNFISFKGSVFRQKATFENAKFLKAVKFEGVTFESEAIFSEATFYSAALFVLAKFNKGACFLNVEFCEVASFKYSQFLGSEWVPPAIYYVVDFEKSIFSKGAEFVSTYFSEVSNFREARFTGAVTFNDAKFKKSVCFVDAVFEKEPSFDIAEFEDIVQVGGDSANCNMLESLIHERMLDASKFYRN
ncbi:MAG: pentapeptide repeat-containing protein [Corynebacterium sp.]|uniref:pentapeptide repeat-containing protein n=1 Tax=Corynebacterium sp. TaxID=1720 RepID=UPI0026DC653E|nr:pentapeptide repeat-containing protein [Corynebacterium sp.]MDO4761519.1 pentapeptide repeat-containing protein [Corynebacterium sp.]